MLKIAIVEDSREYADILVKKISETDFRDEMLIEAYTGPESFLEELKRGKRYQVCFSDIQMPGMNGVQLAEEIRKIDRRMLLVFLSSYSAYATEGYRVEAFDYLLKENVDDGWEALVERMVKRLEDDREKVYRIISQNRVEVIQLSRVIYIYKEGKYCHFVLEAAAGTKEDKEITAVRKPLSQVGEELQAYKNFIQANKGYIINIDKIREYTAEKILMENGDRIVVGRIHVARVREQVMRYMEEL